MKRIKYLSIAPLIAVLSIFVFIPLSDTTASSPSQTVQGAIFAYQCFPPPPTPPPGPTVLSSNERGGPCGVFPAPDGTVCVPVVGSTSHTFNVAPGALLSVEATGTTLALCGRMWLEDPPAPTCTTVTASFNYYQANCTAPSSGQLTITVFGFAAVEYTLSVSEIENSEPSLVDAETLAGRQRVNQSASIPYIIYLPTVQNDIFIDLWHLDENGVGQPLLYISNEQLLALPAYPAENLLFASTPDGLVNIYKLTTGEYQVNIGPLAEGKVYTTIFDAIPPTTVTHSTWIVPSE